MKSIILVGILLLLVKSELIYTYIAPAATVNTIPLPTKTSTVASKTFFAPQSSASQVIKTPTINQPMAPVYAPPVVQTVAPVATQYASTYSLIPTYLPSKTVSYSTQYVTQAPILTSSGPLSTNTQTTSPPS